MQCYSCFDRAMYEYHGTEYKVIDEQLKYLESYKKLGMPVIDCLSCGSRKKLVEKGDGRWQEVFTPSINKGGNANDKM